MIIYNDIYSIKHPMTNPMTKVCHQHVKGMGGYVIDTLYDLVKDILKRVIGWGMFQILRGMSTTCLRYVIGGTPN